MDNFVKLVAVLGFILACISLTWQIWTYFHSRKEDIRATLSIGGRSLQPGTSLFGLFLDIWNNGNAPVYVKSVALAWGDEGRQIGKQTTELIFHPYPVKKEPLQPGEGTSYVLPAPPPNLLRNATRETEDTVWVSVKSAKGEVLRLKGHAVFPLLAELAKASAHIHNSKAQPSNSG